MLTNIFFSQNATNFVEYGTYFSNYLFQSKKKKLLLVIDYDISNNPSLLANHGKFYYVGDVL